MLPAQYRMRRSGEFGTTVGGGARSAQADLVVYADRDGRERGKAVGPKIGLIVAKAVGSAVERHRVSRRLRHVARNVIEELAAGDRIVIRAKPSSRKARSAELEAQLRAALERTLDRTKPLAGSGNR